MRIFTRIPLPLVKLVCVSAALSGIFFAVLGNWIVGLCLLLGAYLFEKNLYRCPECRAKLEMKRPIFASSRCPHCHQSLG